MLLLLSDAAIVYVGGRPVKATKKETEEFTKKGLHSAEGYDILCA